MNQSPIVHSQMTESGLSSTPKSLPYFHFCNVIWLAVLIGVDERRVSSVLTQLWVSQIKSPRGLADWKQWNPLFLSFSLLWFSQKLAIHRELFFRWRHFIAHAWQAADQDKGRKLWLNTFQQALWHFLSLPPFPFFSAISFLSGHFFVLRLSKREIKFGRGERQRVLINRIL